MSTNSYHTANAVQKNSDFIHCSKWRLQHNHTKAANSTLRRWPVFTLKFHSIKRHTLQIRSNLPQLKIFHRLTSKSKSPRGKAYLYTRFVHENLALKSKATGAHASTRMFFGKTPFSIFKYISSLCGGVIREWGSAFSGQKTCSPSGSLDLNRNNA